jgi:outer membrane protein assembly factor BamB
MWRYDAARTAASPEPLPAPLLLQWVRELPIPRPTYREARLQFDAGYEPVVLGKTMFVASSQTESVLALETDTGNERWEFFAEGPIRLAPAAWQNRFYFGSDDGYFYCVDAENGQLVWKFQGVPSGRKVLGNGRMISLWPIRGGAVIHEGRVYFAAGVWPLEGGFHLLPRCHLG